jgi:hypothetical protein
MEFEGYLKISLHSNLTNRKQKFEIKLYNITIFFSLTGVHCYMVLPKDQL